MNAALGNSGKTVIYTDPLEVQPVDQIQSLRELSRDMNDGKVDLLLIMGGNPVYNAPVDFNFDGRNRESQNIDSRRNSVQRDIVENDLAHSGAAFSGGLG